MATVTPTAAKTQPLTSGLMWPTFGPLLAGEKILIIA